MINESLSEEEQAVNFMDHQLAEDAKTQRKAAGYLGMNNILHFEIVDLISEVSK